MDHQRFGIADSRVAGDILDRFTPLVQVRFQFLQAGTILIAGFHLRSLVFDQKKEVKDTHPVGMYS